MSESKSFGIGRVRDATCVTCHGCGQMIRGRRALAEHKTVCVPTKGDEPEPCTCFKKGTNHPETGISGSGTCQRHEGDAW